MADTSSVYNVEFLDVDLQGAFGMPWVFETDGQWFFATEDEACMEQRRYRVQTGHNPITGERWD